MFMLVENLLGSPRQNLNIPKDSVLFAMYLLIMAITVLYSVPSSYTTNAFLGYSLALIPYGILCSLRFTQKRLKSLQLSLLIIGLATAVLFVIGNRGSISFAGASNYHLFGYFLNLGFVSTLGLKWLPSRLRFLIAALFVFLIIYTGITLGSFQTLLTFAIILAFFSFFIKVPDKHRVPTLLLGIIVLIGIATYVVAINYQRILLVRMDIWSEVLPALAPDRMPVMGYGFGGIESLITKPGRYPHNLVLENIANHGYLFGLAVNLTLLYPLALFLKKSNALLRGTKILNQDIFYQAFFLYICSVAPLALSGDWLGYRLHIILLPIFFSRTLRKTITKYNG